MTDPTNRIKTALRTELGEFTSPAKLEAAARTVIEAIGDPGEDGGHELTLSERGLVAAIERLIKAEEVLHCARERSENLIASLAPEGAEDWMFDEAVRLKVVEAGAPVTPAVLDMMRAATEARQAIVAAYHGGVLPEESQIPGRRWSADKAVADTADRRRNPGMA